MRVIVLSFLVFCQCLCVASNANATVLYGITFGNQLVTINPVTGVGSLVGNLSSPMAAFGLGVRGNQLYTYDQTADLIRELNPFTAASIGSIDIGAGNLSGEGAIDFRASDGIGYLSSSAGGVGRLFSFDITVPSSTPITAVAGLNPSLDGLAFNSSNVLFGISQGATQLVNVNQLTGTTTVVGNTGITMSSSLAGLDFDSNGNLFTAISGNATTASFLYRVNPNNGLATLIGDIGFNGVSGLAFLGPSSIVPEPMSVTVFGLLWMFAFNRRQSRAKQTN